VHILGTGYTILPKTAHNDRGEMADRDHGVNNAWISSKNRATALSSLNLLTQSPYIFLSPLLGMMIDRSSPNMFAWWLGVGIVSGLGFTYLRQILGKRYNDLNH